MSGINAGDAACSSGLSKRIYDNWTGDAGNGFASPLPPAAQAYVKSHAWQWAQAIRDQLVAEAVFADCYCSSAQSIPSNAATVVDFDTKVTDTGAGKLCRMVPPVAIA